MKNKKTNEQPATAQPARMTYAVEANKLIFRVEGGERLFEMDRDAVLCLLDRDRMQELFRLAKRPNEAFAELDTIEFAARLHRLVKKGLSLSKCAQFLGINDQKLRHFYGYSREKYHPASAPLEAEIKRQGEEEKDYCRRLPSKAARKAIQMMDGPPPKEQPPIFVNAQAVKQHLRCGASIDKIARDGDLDIGDFKTWLEKNKPILDVL